MRWTYCRNDYSVGMMGLLCESSVRGVWMLSNERDVTNVQANSVARDIEADLSLVREFIERKTVEETSRGRGSESENENQGGQRFRELVETTSDLVWETDLKGVYVYVSPIVRDMLGYTPEEILGKRAIFDLMPLKEASQMSKLFTAATTAQKPFRLLRNMHRHKDGHQVLIETSGVPFFDRSGNLRGYRGVHRDITGGQDEDDMIKETMRKLERVVESTIKTITLTVEMRDRYIAGHHQRVAQLGRAVAKEMVLPYERLEVIHVAGLLHDLGKIFVPVEILNKPGDLTGDERAAIRSHPKAAYDVLRNVEFPWPIADIVLQHHERMDGSGYPSGLKGEEILLEARILGVADVVEAMSSPRSYRPAWDIDKAFREVARNKGVLYDSNVVEACLNIFLDKGFKFQREPVASPAS